MLLEIDTTELILKFGWLGWKGDLRDIDSLVDWLYKEYGIYIEKKKSGAFSLMFQSCVLCDYFGVNGKDDIVEKILPDITLLWKCEDGKLKGPSLDNFEEPKTDWT